ncbi:hypothetical protein BDW02DRAFT_527719 [Decorospora gaudefroyi]|uniref:BRCT domain-containing protein n=1 Tax=Decorospora gaudefroyi TaxID=184978 RepID=A0A6A5KA17_9PLEO|nr:hypothetical protein BDW02DRAFT_527719 [Decorospora gaudefroyi]
MGWTLVATSNTGSPGSSEFNLSNEETAYVVLPINNPSGIGIVRQVLPQLQTVLAQIVVGPWGMKLEAVNDTLSILPGHTDIAATATATTALNSKIEKYQLQPRVGEHSEAIILRHGDMIYFLKSTSNLTCHWTDSEVQVNSSATDAVQIAVSAHVNGVAETPEEETEDEDLDNTITVAPLNHDKFQPRATPQLSNQRSVVVQETPTAARFNSAAHYPYVAATESANDEPAEPVKNTPSSSHAPADQTEPETETGTEAFSKVHTGESQNRSAARKADVLSKADISLPDDATVRKPSRSSRAKSSPQVQIPPKSSRKRATPILETDDLESELEAIPRSKRAKRSDDDDDTQDSRMSNIDVEPREVPKKGKKRLSDVAEVDEATTIRSQTSSQRSTATTNISADAYHGPTPRIASSNSAITKAHNAVKFLKKQGGTYVENLSDEFNVVCVRDGDLPKKSKVLHAIARGTPIVTDKWLLDSAKAGRFLSLSAYKLSAPKQEREWKFKLDDIFGQPQTPFEGYTIHFTKSLKAFYSPFNEIEAVCKAAGAKSVTSARMNKTGDVIVLAMGEDDTEAQKLIQDGVKCYTRDLITFSIVRGAFNLDSDEFKIGATAVGEAPKEKKKKGRKSV